MKKSLLCFLILLMVPLASVAYDFEVDEIYFPFKQNLFVVIVHKYVFHPQQLEKSSNLQQTRSQNLSTSITAV